MRGRRRWSRRVLLGVVTITLVATVPAVEGQDGQAAPGPSGDELAALDDALLHATITPPGASLLEKEAELRAYDDLVWGYPTLTEAEITERYFKDGRFREVTDVAREYRPRGDVRVVRDARWGVPHIYGESDAAAAFGAGYTAIEDRLPIILLLIALGRAEAFELLGTAPAWLADAELARLYGYTEAEFQAMIDRLPAVYGTPGRELVALLDQMVLGMNHAVADMASGVLPTPVALADSGVPLPGPFRTTDIVAIVSIVRALFGAGGGGEMGKAARWAAMVAEHGPERARVIWDDFRNRLNDDVVVHTTDSFPYHQRPADVDSAAHPFGFSPGTSGVEGTVAGLLGNLFGSAGGSMPTQLTHLADAARIRLEHLRLDTPLGSIDLSRPGSMSNHLVVDGTLSSTGFPILLGGPQAGYFDPQILAESELHGDRIHARGAGFPGMGLVVIGRNQEAAWTATAGGSDMIDTYIEKLCEPDGSAPSEQSGHYVFRGQCIAMEHVATRAVADLVPVDLVGRELLPDIVAERTVHGPVVARGTVGAIPVAVSRKRSTFGKELDAAISILKLNRNEVPDGETFVDVFEESHNLSTNWAFANAREIAYVHGGLYPIRPANIDPDFPVWGTGEWEWATGPDGADRYLAEHPHDIRPDRHYVVSWNNRPAPGWGASDGNWGHSALYRADMLEDQILASEPGTISPVRMVQMMEHAGLTDFRGSHIVPLALRILEAVPPPSPRDGRMRDLLAAWVRDGALRRDADRDGFYEHGAAVAIIDGWWAGIIRGMYDPVVGDVARVSAQGFHDAPGAVGSAFQGGFYGQVWTDLSMVLGDPVRSPTSQIYCGSSAIGVDGNVQGCARRLWAALSGVGDALAPDLGDDPGAWFKDARPERIKFLPTVTLSMHWVNRPTTQVLAMFGRHADRERPSVRVPLTLPATGGADALVPSLLLGIVLIARITLRRRIPPARR